MPFCSEALLSPARQTLAQAGIPHVNKRLMGDRLRCHKPGNIIS
jgi:hypothetical protein